MPLVGPPQEEHIESKMASSPSGQDHRKMMNMMVPQLLTPEEPLVQSFTQPTQLPPIQTASPPVSPEFRSFSTQPSFEQTDHVLYPEQTTERSTSERPLFGNTHRWQTPDRQQSPGTESSLSVPTPRTEHESPLQSGVEWTKPVPSAAPKDSQASQADLVGPVALLNTYGLDYYRYCLAQSEEHRRRRMERKLPPINASNGSGRDQYTQKMVSALGRNRVEKPRAATHSAARSKVAKAAPARTTPKADVSPAMPKRESPAKRINRRQPSTSDAGLGAYSQTMQPKPRTRAAPSKKIDDKVPEDWALIPDRCPPASSLDSMNKKLTVQWTNNNILDLSKDPDRDHLHPQELEIAQVLRLKCNQYLANKRRIFMARLSSLQDGKEFNKTSAQTSTNIDVNKASRLWAAFDGVGWFDEKYYTQWL